MYPMVKDRSGYVSSWKAVKVTKPGCGEGVFISEEQQS